MKISSIFKMNYFFRHPHLFSLFFLLSLLCPRGIAKAARGDFDYDGFLTWLPDRPAHSHVSPSSLISKQVRGIVPSGYSSKQAWWQRPEWPCPYIATVATSNGGTIHSNTIVRVPAYAQVLKLGRHGGNVEGG